MLDAAREALSFIEGRTLDNLKGDRMLVLALIKELEIIGEAASKISDETKSLAPAVPWPLIVGMRHRLIHAYFDVNLDVVWTTAKARLPELAESLERVLDVRE